MLGNPSAAVVWLGRVAQLGTAGACRIREAPERAAMREVRVTLARVQEALEALEALEPLEPLEPLEATAVMARWM
jgi:hypothetical protein